MLDNHDSNQPRSEESAANALKSHQWTGCQVSDEYPGEYVRYCSICGMEDTCEDPLPPCPGESECIKGLRDILGEYLK